jgi:hypothetical protein
MTGLKTLFAAALVSTISATTAFAQAAASEPAAAQAAYPNRDVLNGGALTPAGRLGLELPGGAAGSTNAVNNAYAEVRVAHPSLRARRTHHH